MLFSGCGVALVTPFTEDGIDFAALKALTDWQIDSGTDAIVALGTTGEAATMTERERDEVLSCVLETARRRVPVIAGCGSTDTAQAVRRAKRCRELGADGLLAATPGYLKTTQDGLFAHFMRLADACDAPLMLYNVPSRTGVDLLPETALRLAEHPNIVGIKEASGDLSRVGELARRLAVYSGCDESALWAIALGAKGVISVAANVVPDKMTRLTHAALEGDMDAAEALHRALTPLTRSLFLEPNPIPVKAALAEMGRIQEHLRLPLVPMSKANREILRNILKS